MNARDVKIVIPSSGRADRIRDYTVGLLERVGFIRQAAVFVSESEIEAYEDSLYGVVEVRKGLPGLMPNRRISLESWPAGTPVLSLDDDLLRILTIQGERLLHVTSKEFGGMIEKGFELLDKFRGATWGISPVHNDRWIHGYPKVQVGIPLIEGPIFGVIAGQVDHGVHPGSRFEDIERICKVYSQGYNLVRLNEFVHQQSSNVSGGRLDRALGASACEDARRIEREYPHLITHKFGRLAGQHPCRPVIRPHRWLNNPRDLDEVDALRERIYAERIKVGTEVHSWLIWNPKKSEDAKHARVETAIAELDAALRNAPSYGQDDPTVKSIRSNVRQFQSSFKPRLVRQQPEIPDDLFDEVKP